MHTKVGPQKERNIDPNTREMDEKRRNKTTRAKYKVGIYLLFPLPLPLLLLVVIILQTLHIPARAGGVRSDLGDLGGGGGPVGEHADAELGHADAEELEEAGLAGVEDVAGAADDVAARVFPRGAVGGVAEHDLALDHARGHAEAAQLGLEGVAEGHVVLGGHLAGRGHDHAPGHDELARRDRARAREVHLAEIREVRLQRRRGPVREQQAHGPLEVRRQRVDVVGLALLGRVAERAGHELGLAEEEAVIGVRVRG